MTSLHSACGRTARGPQTTPGASPSIRAACYAAADSGVLRGRGQRRADEVVERAERRLRPLADRYDDLLVRYYGAVSGGENAGHGCPAARIDLYFAARRELDRAFQPVGIRDQPDLNEHAGEFDRVRRAGLPVPVGQADHALAVPQNLAGLRPRDDGGVGQSAQFVLQYRIGAKLCIVLDERDVADEPGKIDGRFDPGIAAADDRDPLALE